MVSVKFALGLGNRVAEIAKGADGAWQMNTSQTFATHAGPLRGAFEDQNQIQMLFVNEGSLVQTRPITNAKPSGMSDYEWSMRPYTPWPEQYILAKNTPNFEDRYGDRVALATAPNGEIRMLSRHTKPAFGAIPASCKVTASHRATSGVWNHSDPIPGITSSGYQTQATGGIFFSDKALAADIDNNFHAVYFKRHSETVIGGYTYGFRRWTCI